MPVFLNNVDDYLGPSQACVNPLFTAPSNSTQANKSSSKDLINQGDSTVKTDENQRKESDLNTRGGIVQSRRRIRQRPRIIQAEEDTPQRKEPVRLLRNTDDGLAKYETNHIDINTQSSKKKKATVTLSDCLSCSGCVTSAEAVLMSHHSIDKLREVALAQQSVVEGKRKQIVFTISAAALADLHRHVYIDCNNEVKNSTVPNPSRHDFLKNIANFLKSEFGGEIVIDGVVTQRIALLESAHEFCQRYRQEQKRKERHGVALNASNREVTSVALSSTQTRYIKKKLNGNGSMVPGNMNADAGTKIEVTVVDHPPGLVLESDDDCTSAPIQNEVNSNTVHLHNQTTALPVLASSCPGFVCLVEKTAAPVVPLLSSVKSPMAVAGALLKSEILTHDDVCSNKQISQRKLFHVAVMPCHDKKLEAGRNDFSWERQTLLNFTSAINGDSEATTDGINNTKDIVNEVDLVLTTGELLEILTSSADKALADGSSNSSSAHTIQEFLVSLRSAAESNTSQPPCKLITDLDLSEQDASDTSVAEGEKSTDILELDLGVHGSGSYADFIFRYAAWDLFGYELPRNKPLPWKGAPSSSSVTSAVEQSPGVIHRRRRRQDTTDLRSITLYKHNDGFYSCNECEPGCDEPIPVLNFATAYGFKNVQLVLQSLSKDGYTAGSVDVKGYDYVEVMACPSGCPNGGGQIGAKGQRETPKETKERVKRTISLIPLLRPFNESGSFASSLYGLHDAMDTDVTYDQEKFKLKDGCFGKTARRLLHTRFHVVPKLELSTGVTAGIAISDTKW